MMLLIREFESVVARAYKNQDIPGFCHVSIGQEAVPVGVLAYKENGDAVTSTHRGHGHALAAGIPPDEIMAELFAKETGVCAGRGGSMHVADPSRGILGANGIVAGGLPIAAGASWAMAARSDENVTFAFCGDGALAQGAFHEAVNLAATWALPVVFVCENNHYAEFSPTDTQGPDVPIHERISGGYGMPSRRVDGNDLDEVMDASAWGTELARGGDGPAFIEAETYRWEGHYVGDPGNYRPEGELADWQLQDPIERYKSALLEAGTNQPDIEALDADVAAEIEDAVERAREASEPDPATATQFVYAQ